MAINYGAKLFESTSVVQQPAFGVTTTVPAGSLLVVAAGGKRSGATLNLNVVTDSNVNPWTKKTYPSSYRCIALAWVRTSAIMDTSDWIKVWWNGTPSAAWISCHYFTNAAGTAHDSATNAGGPSATASATVDVPGTEYLILTALNLAYDFGITTTPLNSMTERDTHTTSPQQREFLSRNTSGGSTFEGGTALSPSTYWSAVSVSFAAEAPSAPPAGATVVGGIIGV